MQCTVTFMTDSSLIQYCCYRIIRTTVNHLSIRQVFKMNEDTYIPNSDTRLARTI